MSKRFKLRLGQVIPTFNSCRSKDPSSLPSNPTPLPLLFMLSPVKPKSINIGYPPPPPPKSSKSHYSALTNFEIESSREFQWKQEEKYHVISKISDINNTIHRLKIDESDCDIASTPPATMKKKSKQRKQKQSKLKQRKQKQRVRFSTSSADSGGGGSLFSEEETETLFSSIKTFSTNSSIDFDTHLATIRESPPPMFNKKKVKRARKVNKTFKHPLPETESPARLSSVFKRLMPCKAEEKMEGKVKESFAIVKRSEDPFEDFKRSMLEMILEKQMFDVVELEELLRCFLSLNSKHHHGVIVDAFSEIWEGLFRVSDSNQCV